MDNLQSTGARGRSGQVAEGLVVTDKKENKVAFPKDAANNDFIRRIKCGYLL